MTAANIGAASSVHTHTTAQVTGLDTALANRITLDTVQEITGNKTWNNYNYYKDALGDTTGLISPNGSTIFQITSLDGRQMRVYGNTNLLLAATNDVIVDKTIAQIDASVLQSHIVSKEWVLAKTVQLSNANIFTAKQTFNYSGVPLLEVGSYNGTPGRVLDVNGDIALNEFKILYASEIDSTKFVQRGMQTAPANASATGLTGEIRFTTDYIYVCVATNTWKRSPLTTW